jgi:peptidoglycan/xylan/chitin deacetylase (PgdA/CDA1 family)
MPKEIFCAFGVDVDAVAGWLGSYGGEDSPCDLSRGLFAGEVGRMRLLRLFERFGIKTTRFVPGHSAETFPEQMRAVADAGHEIGMYGYSHENPVALTPDQEEKIFDKCIEAMTLRAKPSFRRKSPAVLRADRLPGLGLNPRRHLGAAL